MIPALLMTRSTLRPEATKRSAKSADTLDVGEVELVHLHAVDAIDGLLSRRAPPRGDDHVGAGAGERAGRLQTEARVAARDERDLAREVDAADHLARRRARAMAGSDRSLR